MKNYLLPILAISMTMGAVPTAFARVSVNDEAFDTVKVTLAANGDVTLKTTPKAAVDTVPAVMEKAKYVVTLTQPEAPACEDPDSEDPNCVRINTVVTIDAIAPDVDYVQPINCSNANREDHEACNDDVPVPPNCDPAKMALVTEQINWRSLYMTKWITTGIVGAAGQFKTSSSTNYKGLFEVVATPESNYYIRRMWFSECPMGEPVKDMYMVGGQQRNACDREGNEFALTWSQKTVPDRVSECGLQRDKVYFLNQTQRKGFGPSPNATSQIIRSSSASGTF